MASESQKLPDTCPATSQSQQQSQTQTQSSQPLQPWGYLFPIKPKVKWISCINPEYLIGRSPKSDLILGDEIDAKIRCQFSKEHFRIRRAALSVNSSLKIVHIDDLSFNGTFINGKKLGRGRSAVLRNNDKISLAVAAYDAFVYLDREPDLEVRSFPATVLDQYCISSKLGCGSYGEVRLVFKKSTGKGFAMKVIQKNKFLPTDRTLVGSEVLRVVNREINILKKLRHNFVIQFHDVLDYPDTVFLVMELVHGGELFEKVTNGLKESQAKYYFYQLALAIRYLHRQGIIHRDIKLENILLTTDTPPQIKLVDFGLSNFVDSESLLKTHCGTPMYMAPEVLASEGRPGSYDTQADVWSMGIVLYMCLSSITPFIPDDPKRPLSKQILTGYYSFPRRQWRYISHNAKDLVKRMLVVDPTRRITIDKILLHPWLQDVLVRSQVSRMLRNEPFAGKENVIEEVEETERGERRREDAGRHAKRPKIVAPDEADTSSHSSSQS